MSKKNREAIDPNEPDALEQHAAGNCSANDSEKKPLETKDIRFKRLANKRVSAALKRIGYVRNLANKNQYEYTDEQAQKINLALSRAIDEVSAAFAGAKKEKLSFEL